MRPLGDIARIDATNGPWPLHLTAAARAVERDALASRAPFELMAGAGFAVARLALALAPHAARIHVFAGPGNNGGDGLVAARHLRLTGKTVTVSLVGETANLPADAARAWREAADRGLDIAPWGSAPATHDLAIDALLGIGGTRAPHGALAQAIASMNAHAAPVLAVDIPTGLHADTGALLGDLAVHATATLSLLTLKPGCFTGHGRDHAGTVWLASLGVPAPDPSAWLAGPPNPNARAHATHKGSHGDVAVIGGAPGMVGAAWLAARAALAAGAGRVYCSLLDETATGYDPARPELMARRAWWRAPPAVLGAATVVCGCGGGDAVRATLAPLLSHAARLVLDADALNAIAADKSMMALLKARAGRARPTLLTPHPLEAARLLGIVAAEVQRDRLGAAVELATRTGSAVLLKGSGTVVAAPGVLPWINPTGNAALASAGTGDVLAGWVAGLWAQRPELTALAVAAAATWWHGRAADRYAAAAGGAPLRAADLVEQLAAR